MNNNQKTLLIAGAALIVICAIYLSTSSIPNTPGTALFFPLSILGILFGAIFLLWSISWMLLQKFKVVQ